MAIGSDVAHWLGPAPAERDSVHELARYCSRSLPLQEVMLKARFIGMSPWESPGDCVELLVNGKNIDLHNDSSLLGVSLNGYPKSILRLDFKHVKQGIFMLEFQDVGELVLIQDAVSSDGWQGAPDEDPSGIDSLMYYEYGSDLPPVFEIQSLTLRLKFRARDVSFRLLTN